MLRDCNGGSDSVPQAGVRNPPLAPVQGSHLARALGRPSQALHHFSSSADERTLTVAVAIRMKRMGRKHREYYRICATDRRNPRDGRVIEELGTYDPHVPETDARCTLNSPRVEYWISVGAQPSDAVRVLIKKYGTNGTHVQKMEEARARLKLPKIVPDAGPPALVPEVKQPESAAAPAAEVPAAEPAPEAAPAEAAAEATAEEAVATVATADSPAESPAAEEGKSE